MDGRGFYIAMELLRGRTLASLCHAQAPKLEVGLVIALGLQALAGLHNAHDAQAPTGEPMAVVHRDVKPSNLFLTNGGTLKLIDFGIAHIAAMGRTARGYFLGSIPYASPEQVRNDPVDARTDLFSLGLVMHELLIGQPILRKSNQAATLSAILSDPIPLARSFRPDVPPALDRAIAWAVQRAPGLRPPSAMALSEVLSEAAGTCPAWTELEIARWLQGQRPAGSSPEGTLSLAFRTAKTVSERLRQRARPRWVMASLVLAASLASGGWWFLRSPRPMDPAGGTVRAEEPAAPSAPTLPAELSARPVASPVPTAPSTPADTPAAPVVAALAPSASPPLRAANRSLPPPHKAKRDDGGPVPRQQTAPPPQQTGTLAFRVFPWATVYVDERPVGNTPLRPMEIPAGKHVVKLVFEERGVTRVQSVEVSPGETAWVKTKLE
jgi:serine/threonine-protein kinase